MRQTNKKLIWSVMIILAVTMAAMVFYLAAASKTNTEEDREIELRYATQIVDNAINKAFLSPITVAKVMSKDANLKEYLKLSAADPTSVEDQVKDYLSSISDGLGYKVMFAVCDASGAYYTRDGISSYIDKNYQGNSEWYGVLMASGKDFDLDVDIEESTDWELSVFINQLIYDDKTLLGVCGTGVEMTQLQNLFELYERIYNVKIDVVDDTGFIQIDTVAERIERDYISLPELDKISDGEYYFEKRSDGDRVITYMADLDMYLVLTNQKSNAADILSALSAPMIIALAGISVSIVLVICAERIDRKKAQGEIR